MFRQPGATYVEYEGTNSPNRIAIGVEPVYAAPGQGVFRSDASIYVANSEPDKTITNVSLTIDGMPFAMQTADFGPDSNWDGLSFTYDCSLLPQRSNLPIRVDATLSDGTTFGASHELNSAQRDTANRSCFAASSTDGLSLDLGYPAIP